MVSAEHYEALRRHAVEERGRLGSDPLGAVLVARSGVAGWMRQWERMAAAETPTAVPPATRPSSEPLWQHELTLVLAGMTAGHLRQDSTS